VISTCQKKKKKKEKKRKKERRSDFRCQLQMTEEMD
jgi:hypothetical protein